MAQASDTTSPPFEIDWDYRRLFRESPAEDSSTDENEVADGLADLAIAGPDPPPEVDVLSFSISRAQAYMKSPETPAVEKARALDISGDYFGNELEGEPVHGSPSEDGTPSPQADTKPADPTLSPPKSTSPLPSSQLLTQEQTRRSFMMRSILGETDANRRRSNSGPTMFGSFKKMLPDMPSMPVLRTNGASATQSRTNLSEQHVNVEPRNTDRGNEYSATASTQRRGRERTTSSYQLASPLPAGLDGNVESLVSPTTPRTPGLHVRSNSESSLYLKRRPTAASRFDDTSAFGDVTEMHNARFKAITDSFQNSTLRMPRLPNIKYNPKRSSDPPSPSVDDVTQQNTQINSGNASKSNHPNHYPNVKNVWSSKKFLEVENSQQRAHPVLSDAFSKLEGDLIIMGGYRGSVLRDAKPPHRQLWAPVKVGLNLRSVDLEVGLSREDEENAYQKVFPSGTLSHIGPIDICRRLLRHANKCPNTRSNKLRVHDWGYDWRLSPDLIGERLIRYLENLECNHPDTPPEKRGVTVIAHSLGGLVTRWAVNKRPELFRGVVYAGAPQHCVNILGPMRNGDNVLLSQKVLTAQVNFTIRMSFALLPEGGRCFINRHTNERYDLNFFDPRTWDEYCLSPCIRPASSPIVREHRKSLIGSISESISSNMPSMPSVNAKRSSWFGNTSNFFAADSQDTVTAEPASEDISNIRPSLPTVESTLEPTMKTGSTSAAGSKPSISTTCTIPLPEAKAYLARTLSSVLAFKLALAHDRSHQQANRYPPHAVIFGKSVPTVYGARVLSREHIKLTDAYDDLAFASGDGVVLASAAQLPEGYRCVKNGRVESERGHVGLLGDLEGVGQCLLAVMRGRERGVGKGCYEKKSA